MAESNQTPIVLCGTDLRNVAEHLQRKGFSAKTVRDPGEVIDGGPPAEPTVVVLVEHAPEDPVPTDTIRRLAAVQTAYPVVVSRQAAHDRIVNVMRAGAWDYVRHDDSDAWVEELARSVGSFEPRPPAYAPSEMAAEISRRAHALQHDVKNPINNILGYVEFLTETPTTKLSDDQREFLDRIAANCHSMLDLLRSFADSTSRLTGLD